MTVRISVNSWRSAEVYGAVLRRQRTSRILYRAAELPMHIHVPASEARINLHPDPTLVRYIGHFRFFATNALRSLVLAYVLLHRNVKSVEQSRKMITYTTSGQPL